MAAAERSRSPAPGGSPVPACMFAPEPGSPGGHAHGAAAACPLRAAFGGEDGEALNGDPEIDLTSKVGPAWGGGRRRTPSPRRAPAALVPAGRLCAGGCPPNLTAPCTSGEREAGACLPPPGREAPLSAPPAPASSGLGGRASGAVWKLPGEAQ